MHTKALFKKSSKLNGRPEKVNTKYALDKGKTNRVLSSTLSSPLE